jgi:hypothetical protein
MTRAILNYYDRLRQFMDISDGLACDMSILYSAKLKVENYKVGIIRI